MLFCSFAVAQKITYNFVAGTDFSKYKTYKWERAEKARYPGEDIDSLVTRAIDVELAKKGLTKVENEPCDLFIIYQLSVTDDIEYSSFRTEVGWVGAGGYYSPNFGGATTNSSNVIKKGALVLEIYDVSQKKRVWETYVTKTLNPSRDLQKNQKNTQKVMAKVLKNYPPPAK
jgi:hypothetical protein